MTVTITPFTDDMISQAAVLLADRHRADRALLPLLPSRFGRVEVCEKAIRTLWEKKVKCGFAAFDGEHMVAYMLGEMVVLDWGRSGYVKLPGYALARGASPDILQDLYARVGDEWVRIGVFNHYIYLSAADKRVYDAFVDLGFGKERVDAMMDLKKFKAVDVPDPIGFTIREAGAGDNALIGSLSNVIYTALSQAPYWHPTAPEVWQELHEGWSELADDKDWRVWLALQDARAVGSVGFTALEATDDDMLSGDQTTYLSIAATQPEARGKGIATRLTNIGLMAMKAEGYQRCYTNWISPNLNASRLWPRFGFEDVAYRMAKKISPMIAWAKP